MALASVNERVTDVLNELTCEGSECTGKHVLEVTRESHESS